MSRPARALYPLFRGPSYRPAPAAGAARLAGITEDATDGVMRLAVERGLLRRELKPPTLLGLDEPERSRDRPPQAARRVGGAN